MRVLKPEIAIERERRILRWVIQDFVQHRRPVASEQVACRCGLGVSSATVRGIMKKLEEEGYLSQSHISGGRYPTDKAYRFYVDYLSEARKLALEERRRIENEYHSQMDEIDRIMAQTSRLLAAVSHSAGFVLSSGIGEQCIARIDFVPMGPGCILVLLVSESGAVKHWPVKTDIDLSPRRLRLMAAFLNEQVAGLPIGQARRVLWDYLRSGRDELRDAADLAGRFLETVERQSSGGQELHIEGLGQLAGEVEETEFDGFFEMLSVMDEKQRFIAMLKDRIKGLECDKLRRASVSIGSENDIKELHNMSLVTRTCRVGSKPVGMIGILGPRHMEYGRMLSLVDFMGSLMEETISQWDGLLNDDGAGERSSGGEQDF
ncbi:MAG: heat-inducible transcriptional repressor HrcA [Elusimicrobiaceae bacterium]|nr:heat-inducible transcriptional repressor HrcA [Elusimicrobiaceae bacterium]